MGMFMCIFLPSCGKTIRCSPWLRTSVALLTLLCATVSAQDEVGDAVRKAVSAVAPGIVRIRIVGTASGADPPVWRGLV